jgi:hypothetical protein
MSEKKADVREEFIKIAKKMAGEMNLKNDEYREYCLNKKGEKYKSKSEIKKLDDILGKVLTEIKEDDFTNDLYKKGITASSLVGDSKTRNRG